VGIGTTFRVWIPTGYEHLPEKQVHFCDQLYPGVSHENKSDSAIDLYLGRHMQVSETNELSSKRDQSALVQTYNHDSPFTLLKKLNESPNLDYVNAEKSTHLSCR